MVSYWKLIDMTNAELIAVGKEKPLTDLKILYENKMNTPTKMVKCFGEDKFKKDILYMTNKSLKTLKEADNV